MLIMKMPSTFQELRSWNITFPCNEHGDFKEHDIVAVDVSNTLPRTLEEGKSAFQIRELN